MFSQKVRVHRERKAEDGGRDNVLHGVGAGLQRLKPCNPLRQVPHPGGSDKEAESAMTPKVGMHNILQEEEKKPKDISLIEAVLISGPLVKKGCTVHQKFTCSFCGSRQTIRVSNVFYDTCSCELCGKFTDITITGCGMTVVGPPDVLLEGLLRT